VIVISNIYGTYKHLIIGVGVVGDATGYMLEKLEQEVWYTDTDISKLKDRQQHDGREVDSYDYIWVCTAEWNVDEVLGQFKGLTNIIVIRATTPPGYTSSARKIYNLPGLIHMPEFLRAKHARHDVMNPDRIIMGCKPLMNFSLLGRRIFELYHMLSQQICLSTEYVTPTESELIKLVSNAYLSTQVSFWNEIKWACRKFNVDPKAVVMGVAADKRVSSYGWRKFGKFSGFCLPKDLKSLILAIKTKKGKCSILESVQEVNENESEEAKPLIR